MRSLNSQSSCPGRDDAREFVYLPIDAKFPKDVYEQLLDAYDAADSQAIETAGKLLETTIKKMAKDISDKYLAPPATTDFGIMFLPFEGIYAEVVRRSALLEDLQRNYKVVVTGPTTLAAILNSLQMGFRTLAIQKHSGEVWTILGAVKKEFEKVGGMLEKAQKNLQTASGQIEEVLGTRTRAIQRKLKDVDTLSDREARAILPEIGILTEEDEKSRIMKKRQIPHTYVIIFYIILFCAAIDMDYPRWAIHGKYQPRWRAEPLYMNPWKAYLKHGRYSPPFIKDLWTRRISSSFILIIGGAFWIVNDSKAFDIGTVSFLRKARKMEK